MFLLYLRAFALSILTFTGSVLYTAEPSPQIAAILGFLTEQVEKYKLILEDLKAAQNNPTEIIVNLFPFKKEKVIWKNKQWFKRDRMSRQYVPVPQGWDPSIELQNEINRLEARREQEIAALQPTIKLTPQQAMQQLQQRAQQPLSYPQTQGMYYSQASTRVQAQPPQQYQATSQQQPAQQWREWRDPQTGKIYVQDYRTQQWLYQNPTTKQWFYQNPTTNQWHPYKIEKQQPQQRPQQPQQYPFSYSPTQGMYYPQAPATVQVQPQQAMRQGLYY